MSEYEAQAINFLKECNATLTVAFSHVGKNELWGDEDLREIYHFTITTPRGSYTSLFYDSVYNYQQKIKAEKVLKEHAWFIDIENNSQAVIAKKHTPNAYDILSCLDGYMPSTFEDFCSEFGYDTDSIRALKTYIECQKQYDGLRKIFTSEQLEKLNEIW